MNRLLRLLSRGLAAFVALVSALSLAQADPAQLRAKLLDAARATKMPSYERTMPSGVKRVYVNPQSQHLRTMEATLSNKSDVLEIIHFSDPTVHHTQVMFDRQLVHTQYITGTNNWRLHSWGNGLRASNTKMFSAMISLTPVEANNLRNRLTAAYAEEGPEHLAGAKWEKGHLGMSLGVPRLNCVATWSEMPIGEHGEKLHQLVGLGHSYSANPQGLEIALETQGNERVFGIGVYGPAIADFEQNQQADKVMR